MYKRMGTMAALVVVLALVFASVGLAEGGVIRAYLTLRVTSVTQDSVVNMGDDLSMELEVEGVTPAIYQWYFANSKIEGANQKVYNIVNAALDDAGVYRMDAFDADGKMLLSVDVAVRVIDPTIVPASGDDSISAPAVGMGLAAAVLLLGAALVAKRRITA